jgi:hypothetical protein
MTFGAEAMTLLMAASFAMGLLSYHLLLRP